ncbi:helix-turn-helix domain-containing protein [Clostridium grantii]|uniref:Uncharacterized protein n=1 Tax=Clostridium grantii DSM 8605 TaxID=1121316 RepID=A0A1M5WW43_9CLOT|nr:helix-turn-helix transcriptional regulator [Clostridium grantii]SHH91797.1 hypothetical protein SAMN02745207_03162 [Clostridium grantii DSM 8605]
MDIQLLTFGEYLSVILKKKNISITKLANLTNTKSRNTIHRLLKDESSIDVIESFKSKLIRLDPLSLSASERKQLNKSVEVSKVGKDKYYARNVLLQISKSKKSEPIYFHKIFGKTKNNLSTLMNLFHSYLECSTVNIIIFDLPIPKLAEILISLIHTATNTKISIEHIIFMDDSHSKNADTFSSIYKLINFKNYNGYYTTSLKHNSLLNDTTSIFSNFIVVNKVPINGDSSTDLICFNNKTNFSILSNNPGDFLYTFYLNYYNTIKFDCQSIRRYDENNTHIEKLIDLCDYLLHLEKNTSEYLIKQNLCFQMIPSDILYNMLEDANFLGLSENHPQIRELIKINLERFKNYFTVNKMKITLFTKRGLRDFVNTRMLTDHFYCFREFTKDEVIFTLKFILKQIKENNFFKLYLLKDNYYIGNIEFSYYENHVIYIVDSCCGYGEDFDEGIITANPIVHLFDDFIKNELIPHHTLPESEGIEFLEHLISTII